MFRDKQSRAKSACNVDRCKRFQMRGQLRGGPSKDGSETDYKKRVSHCLDINRAEPLLESFRVVDRTGDWELIKQRFDNRVQTESVWPDRHPDLYLKFVTQHHVKDAVLNVDEKQLNIAVERTALPISEEIKSRRAAGQAERSC